MVDFNKLRSKMKKHKQKKQESGGGSFWKPTYKDDVTRNVIRFLPNNEGEELPFINVMMHEFSSNGRFFRDVCLTTSDDVCPICEKNKQVWDAGNKKLASSRKRKDTYYCKVLVIDDTNKPENNGKIFTYRFGVTVWGFIESAIFPEFEEDEEINAFSIDADGANFRLASKKNPSNKAKVEFTGTKFLKKEALDIEKYPELKNYDDITKTDYDKMKTYQELMDKFREFYGAGVKSESDEDKPKKSKPKTLKDIKPKSGSKKRKEVEEKVDDPMKPNLDDFDDDIPF